MTATLADRARKTRRVLPGWVSRVSWQWMSVSLVAGGMIHILATLVVPKMTTASAWHRLSARLPVNRMVVLPPATAGNQALPYMGPDTRVAICRYDLSQGPLVVSVTLPDKGWSLGLYSPDGDNFFAVPAQEQRIAEVKFTLRPPAERLLGIFNWGRGVDATISEVVVPRIEGLVVIRAPLRGRVYQSEAEAVLARASCVPQRT